MNTSVFDYLLAHHSFYALFKLHWVILLLGLVVLYVQKVAKSPLYPVASKQKYYFYVAIVLLFICKATPIDVIANHYLFSMYTLQLSITYFVVIPLLLLSIPTNVLRQYIWNHRTKFTLTFLAHPWLSLIMFNGILSIYFLPTVFNAVHTHVIFVYIVQIVLFITATFMWWVIIQPIPELKNLEHLTRALYIFLASVLLFPIGFFYVIVQKEMLSVYIPVAGAMIPSLTSIYDQQAAGGVLKLIQLTSYAIALLVILLKWGKQEEEKEGTVDEENVRYVRGVVIHLGKNKK